MKQRTPIKRTAPPKRRNYARHKREWLRSYGSIQRADWISMRPCVIGLRCLPSFRSENAHIESGGKGRKADADKIVPMCQRHHKRLHSMGRLSFEQDYNVDLATLAAETERRWRQGAA